MKADTFKELVRVTDLKVHQDDRGSLFEMVHSHEMPEAPGPSPMQFPHTRFGQVYVVSNPARGAVRAFHKHRRLWDYFCIVSGVAKFCFVDDRDFRINEKNSVGGISFYPRPGGVPGNVYSFPRPSPGNLSSIVVSGAIPKLLTVPPGVFHGWKSLVDGTILLSVGSEMYDAANPDEVRVPPNYFDQEFGGDPWEIRGR